MNPKTDMDQVYKLLEEYLKKFKLYPHMCKEEMQHWLSPRDGVVQGKNSTRPESSRKFKKLKKDPFFLVETWQKRGMI